MSACDACVRRAWLLARLGPYLERAREQGRRLPLVLALPDAKLLTALGGADVARLARERAEFDPAGARAASEAAGLALVCRCGPGYPERLRGAPDAPATLHVAGARLAELVEAPCVAVVGTRRASPYGQEVAGALGRGLAAAGVTVVSGMALGIDSAAHEGALAAGGRTVAVLAAGAERAYPATKRSLHRRLVERAAVVSELPPGTRAFRWMFPARNRLIAGLAELTVVVEGTERSGSLITAGLAEDLGRDLGAVPGRVTSPLATGPHALLAAGAHLVRDASDVLEALLGAGAAPPPAPAPDLPDHLAPLLARLAEGHDDVGALLAAGLALEDVLAGLTELELLGLAHSGPDGRWTLAAGGL